MPEDDPSDADDAGVDRLRALVAALTVRDVATLVVAAALLVGLAGVVYVALTPQQATDPYTEFYVLGDDGRAADYPTNLTVGERATVTVGVVNHERRQVTYTLLVRTDDRTLVTRQLAVDRDERREETVSYSFDRSGRVRVQFHLYRGTDAGSGAEPYRRLRLWTNVSAPPATVAVDLAPSPVRRTGALSPVAARFAQPLNYIVVQSH
ncbi:DUF1616 domain-containing protein [Haloplanus pelagicus]|uniref:DUF1616 domain-containing protein n=1 Tax=Haloplanus pelagicus TaxID=2949995 RepID=UPI002040EF66|nr:DUF1616 domain-containing protein [Haloplanus sp. HW8-1]